MRQKRKARTKSVKRGDTHCSPDISLSRREREVMHVLYKLGQASGQEIRRNLAADANYSTVRTILAILERKGWVRHLREGVRYVYAPVFSRSVAGESALKLLIETFFGNSPKRAITAILTSGAFKIEANELDELRHLLQQRKASQL